MDVTVIQYRKRGLELQRYIGDTWECLEISLL